MNFAIDAAIPSPPPMSATNADEVADMMLTRAFLCAIAIQNKQRVIHTPISVRVEQICRTRSTTYIHYSIANSGKTAYQLATPVAFELKLSHSPISLASFAHTQLDERAVKKLGRAQLFPLTIARNESEQQEIQPGSSADGVVAIRQDLQSPCAVQLVFGEEMKATFVM